MTVTSSLITVAGNWGWCLISNDRFIQLQVDEDGFEDEHGTFSEGSHHLNIHRILPIRVVLSFPLLPIHFVFSLTLRREHVKEEIVA